MTASIRARRFVMPLAAALVVVLGLVLAAVAVAPTRSAWTDETRAQATVTAGQWSVPVANACTAWNQAGKPVSCSISGIRYTSWQESPTRRAREYHVDFRAPGAKKITFTVDLTSATTTSAPEAPAWSWRNAGVGSGGQFVPSAGWTCSSLPTVSGQASEWHSQIYFQVYEDRAMRPVMCP